jgi:Zn-dependent peptidase ImmA (M78 family)
MAGTIPAFEAHSGEIVLIERVTIHELIRKVRELARRTRDDISNAGLQPDDFEGIAQYFGLTLCWAQLPNNNPGCYLKRERKIVLNNRVQLAERLNFTFDHELLHDRIEHDDDLLSLLADAYIPSEETMIERLCNAGAAELLMPSDDVRMMVREHDFSPGLIPLLCDRYNASSIAVAFQLIFTATHQCNLVIAEPTYVVPGSDLPMLIDTPRAEAQVRLVMIYTAASPTARYPIKRGQIVPVDHPICTAWHQQGEVVSCQARMPFPSGKRWDVDFDALYFRGKVFAFFNISHPAGKEQMQLL